MSALEQLSKHTVVVADTGDFSLIEKYKPTDATTNPSLILQVASKPQYSYLLDEAISFAKSKSTNKLEQLTWAMDKVFVNFGLEILKKVPGRVSTEVDARLSFDTKGTVEKAKRIINLYKQAGIDKERVLIKLSSTWEGIQAGKLLEEEGIHCNLTLLFTLTQAIACAEANVTLISPFVNRTNEYFDKVLGKQDYSSDHGKEPGVVLVKEIYNYYKKYDYKTVIMGASIKFPEQAIALSGCDLLTINPGVLEQLRVSDAAVSNPLNLDAAKNSTVEALPNKLTESEFRYRENGNAMAVDKISDGIRIFANDSMKLEKMILERL